MRLMSRELVAYERARSVARYNNFLTRRKTGREHVSRLLRYKGWFGIIFRFELNGGRPDGVSSTTEKRFGGR